MQTEKVKKSTTHFGTYVFQDGLGFENLREIAGECERLGFESIWLKDNLIPWIGDWFKSSAPEAGAPMLECWTALAALAPLSGNLRLGTILVNLYRRPSLIAKMVATLDVISRGRLEFGLSAGWHESESASYGIPFPDPRTRARMMDESIRIIKKMWTQDHANFKGEFYQVEEAICEPKPIQRPHPPLWIGGKGKLTLKTTVRNADGWIYGLCSKDEYFEILRRLEQACRDTGRDWQSLRKAWYGIVLIGDSDPGILKKETDRDGTNNLNLPETVVAGTPSKIIEELSEYANKGVTWFVPHFPWPNTMSSLRLFASEVMPHVQ